MLEYKVATINDIEDILKLHRKYHINTISKEDIKDGFVTTNFTYNELKDLIEQEQGIFIAKDKNRVIAYVMSASWEFWKRWEMFEFMAKNLKGKEYKGVKINTKNSYQYGPICIDKEYRGGAVLKDIFNFAKEHMAKRFDILVTFVNKNNRRSFIAHHKKLNLDILSEFEYNKNRYYELVTKI